LGAKHNVDRALGGNYSQPLAPRAPISPLIGGVFEVTLNNTGTGWDEVFLIGVPKAPVTPAPVLVVYHGYGETPRDLLYSTSYFQKGMARGWIVVAPTGAHKYNFAIDYAQENVLAALTWVVTYLPIDAERLYAVGFSMGGGMSTTFAARHLDPLGPRFAAVANHTGATSIRHSFHNITNKDLLLSPLMFGGTPNEEPFRYQTASTIDLRPSTDLVDQNTDLARNLLHVPVYNFAALYDPNPFLVHQVDKTHEQLLLRGNPSEHTTTTDTRHEWYTLDEDTILDWFEPKTLQKPDATAGVDTLADRDGTWFHFTIQQAATGAFTPFTWTSMPVANRLYVYDTKNLASISLDPLDLGLDSSQPFDFVYHGQSGLDTDLVLEGYTQIPTDVLRNGQSTVDWTYDAAEDTVTLHEYSPSGYPIWRVEP